jgi:hypothetical protein
VGDELKENNESVFWVLNMLKGTLFECKAIEKKEKLTSSTFRSPRL